MVLWFAIVQNHILDGLAEHYPIDKALNKIDPITLKDKIIEKSKRFLFKTGLITVARHLNKGKKVEVVENK